MSVRDLYMGHAEGGGVYRAGRGYTDGGTPYSVRVTSRPLLFGGLSDEGTATAVYLGVTQRPPPLQEGDPYDEVVFTLTPIVDGREEQSRQVRVRMQPVSDPANPAPRVFRRYEVGVYRAVYRGGEEVRREALRGVSIQVRVELVSTDIAVEGLELEVEMVRESNPEQGE